MGRLDRWKLAHADEAHHSGDRAMNASVECQVCRQEISLRSAIASEPWPVSICCPHCENVYGLDRSSYWRSFWLIAPIAAGVCAIVASSALAVAGGLIADVASAMAGFAGFASVVYLAMWSQVAIVRRLYQQGAFQLLGTAEATHSAPESGTVLCETCGRGTSISNASCPMCGAELAGAAAFHPIVCSACGECVRIPQICCPACRSPVGSQTVR
ncbi:MAG TPA: hypothetical protein VML55_26265 [Planctomycetaceae bacterium]|nr:hypothetical protein [Planctomycetaceae bacterium]